MLPCPSHFHSKQRGTLLESPDGRLPGVSTYVFTDAVGTSYCYDRVLADLPADPGTYGAAGVEGPVGGPTGNTLNTPNNELFYIPIGLGVHTGPTGRSPEPTSAKPGTPDPASGSPLATDDGRANNADKGDGICLCGGADPSRPTMAIVVNDPGTAASTDLSGAMIEFPAGIQFGLWDDYWNEWARLTKEVEEKGVDYVGEQLEEGGEELKKKAEKAAVEWTAENAPHMASVMRNAGVSEEFIAAFEKLLPHAAKVAIELGYDFAKEVYQTLGVLAEELMSAAASLSQDGLRDKLQQLQDSLELLDFITNPPDADEWKEILDELGEGVFKAVLNTTLAPAEFIAAASAPVGDCPGANNDTAHAHAKIGMLLITVVATAVTGAAAITSRLSKIKEFADDAAGGIRKFIKKLKSFRAWRNVRRNYWKERGVNGKAPTRRVKIRKKDGTIDEITETKELHHIEGRDIPDPHNWSNLRELWPTEHGAIDPFRHPGYEVIEVLE